jgi:anti-sigma factor RsiW
MTNTPLPYYAAPAGLRERIQSTLRRPSAQISTRRRIAWIGGIAATLLLATGGWFLGAHRGSADADLDAVLDGHLRSLVPGHLTDVASTDQHTVKPWFAGRIDFSPPVIDPATEGFPLVGGRLDVMAGSEVAALVYSHRSHVINLFVRPSDTTAPVAARETVKRGINIVSWSDGGMRFWAVSDLNMAELEQFRGLVSTPHPIVIVP